MAQPADRSRRGDLARHRCRGMFSSIWVATVCVLDLRAFISRAPQPWLAATKEGTTHDGEDRSLRADCRPRWESQLRHRQPSCSISQVGGHWGATTAAAGLSAAGVILRDCLVVQSFTHAYAGTHEQALGRHPVGDRCGGQGPTRLLRRVVAELRRSADGRRHGRGRSSELSGGQPQVKCRSPHASS